MSPTILSRTISRHYEGTLPETIHQKYSELERRRDDIASRLADKNLSTPDSVFDPLLAKLDARLDEIQYDIETLTDLSGNTHAFYEEICNDLADGHSHLQKVEKIISYYELHTTQQMEYRTVFQNISDVVDELCEILDIDLDIIPIVWNQTALVQIISEAVYGLWLPRNIATESFDAFAPIIAHEIAHATFDYRGTILPDPVNEERKRIASEFGDRREQTVAQKLVDWYQELYCDAVGTLTFGPAYAVSLTRRLFSDNPYQLGLSQTSEISHPPDALRYRNVMRILEGEFPADLHSIAQEKTREFTRHLDQLSPKKTHAYTDWWDDQYLEAIVTDAKQVVNQDINNLVSAINRPHAEVPTDTANRARVNRDLVETD